MLFGKTPNNKKFAYTPRFYDPMEEERKEREMRIRQELVEKEQLEKALEQEAYSHRQRIAGSFRNAKKTATAQSDPSASMIRLAVLLIIAVGLIAFIQWGNIAIYITFFAFVPLYLYLKFRNIRTKKP